MEQKVNPWSANLTNGLILGLIGIVYSLVMYFLDLSLNKTQGWVYRLVEIVVLFFLVKSYRDNYMHGMITFGQAMGAGVIIFLYYVIITAIFSYILFAIIDKGLIGKMIAMSEEAGLKKGLSQEQIDLSMKFTRKIMTPPVLAIMTVFGGMFRGTIFSILVAAFVRKEGNPLVNAPAN